MATFPEANERERIVPPYCILYRLADDTVTIFDILEGHSAFPMTIRPISHPDRV